MSQNLIVRPDKNEFLLYSMLIALGLARGDIDIHFLKRKTFDNFKDYTGIGLCRSDYIHHSKSVAYVLTLNEAPDFTQKPNLNLTQDMQNEVEIGSSVFYHLIDFYANTNFESFYKKILPRYREECEFLQSILDKAGIDKLLDDVWELRTPFKMEVIPMPLEGWHSGIGPSIGDVAYQIVGPPFDYSIKHLVGHEGSHPRAKEMLKSINKEIESKDYLLNYAIKNPKYPSSYYHWGTCFEEHFIRAMQLGFIDPVLNSWSNTKKDLEMEKNNSGMVFIDDFYEEIRAYKQDKKGRSLQEAALNILERLGKRYKPDSKVI